jgi:hypothetical protein
VTRSRHRPEDLGSVNTVTIDGRELIAAVD